MSKPRPLSGFPEFLPAERVVEAEVVATLARTFELHGFSGIETRSVEPLDQLLRKGDTSKEVYVLRRLQDADAGSDSGVGLHFDLTVPFARYVLEHAGKLEFPFRRFQIQKAWRGERPQEGRFREFTQADIDIVGRDELPFHHDIEVARVMLDALGRLELPARPPAAGQQPQADPGLLRRHRRGRHRRGDAPRRQARQARAGPGPHPARRRGRADGGAGRPVPGPGRHPCLGRLLRGARPCPRRRARPPHRGPRRAGRAGPWLRAAGDRPGPHRGRPLHRPRPGLLHRHRLRDPPRRLRVARVDLLGRPLRRARQRRADDVPRRRHLPGRQPAAGAAGPAWAGRRQPVRAQCRPRRPRRRGVARATATRSPPRCAPAGSPARSPPPLRSSASRSGTPSGGASRSSGSPRPTGDTRSRTSARGNRSVPTRPPGPHPPRTCARRSSRRSNEL